MNEDPRITEARRLMREVEKEEWQKKKESGDSQICECGHRHDEHGKLLSVNYSAGFCKVCNCNKFILKTSLAPQ